MGFANNKGADQPARPCRLISAIVIGFLESIISKLATGEIASAYTRSMKVYIGSLVSHSAYISFTEDMLDR